MDIREIKTIVLSYRELLIKNKIKPDVIILFGSHAKGCANPDSDIDLAIVSTQFGKNPEKESQTLNLIAYEIKAPLEVIPVSHRDYMKKSTTSPILHEILTSGTVLF